MAKKTVSAKKRVVKVTAMGQLHVHSSFNNVIVSLTNSEGEMIAWSSAGKMGFRGSKKNTPYAAQMAAQDCAKVDMILAFVRLRPMSRDRAKDASQQFALYMVQVSRLLKSLMLLRFHTMVVVLLREEECN